MEALRAVGAYAGRGPWDDDLNAIESAYLDGDGAFLVGEVEGRVITMGALRRTGADRAELKRMRVEPAHQSRGYGTAMLAALEARARALGIATLHLDTSTTQDAARRLYEKWAYRETGRERWRGQDLIYYEKVL